METVGPLENKDRIGQNVRSPLFRHYPFYAMLLSNRNAHLSRGPLNAYVVNDRQKTLPWTMVLTILCLSNWHLLLHDSDNFVNVNTRHLTRSVKLKGG